MRNKEKFINNAEGYTLIEVIIALAITSIAFVAIYALFARSMQSDTEGRYEIIAASLVQEGIEIIKNKREKNEMDWAMWNPTDDGPTPPSAFTDLNDLSQCNPDLDLSAINYSFTCNGGNNINMQYNKTALSGKYELNCSGSGCVGPIFERSCTATGIDTDSIVGNDSLRVVCEVKWKSLLLGGDKRSVRAETVLTDWQQ